MSDKSINYDVTPNPGHEPEPEKSAVFFSVGEVKLAVMSIFTLGFYQFVWFYKNFHCMRNLGHNIWPAPRTIFFPFMAHSLFLAVHKQRPNSQFSPGWLATAVFFLYYLALRLPDTWWLIGLFNFLPLLPVRSAIEQINREAAPDSDPNKRFRGCNYIAVCVGGPIVAITILSSIGFLPIASVIEGSRLWNKDLDYLKAQGLLDRDEEIQYFYSRGFWSITDDGQFISDGYVVSYMRDSKDGELYGGKVAYGDIEDISVAWSASFLDDTVVTITAANGFEFELWISSESGGDRKFVDEMMRRWKNTKVSMAREP